MPTKTNYKDYSQHQKILTLMCRFPDKKWWFPYDFMKQEQGDLFVGYEASARLSELGSQYPEMIETQQAGKYKKRRLCFEGMDQWLPMLPKDLRYAIHRTGMSKHAPSAEQTIPEEVKTMTVSAVYKGRKHPRIQIGATHDLVMEKLKIGSPVIITLPERMTYRDVKAFQKDWKAL